MSNTPPNEEPSEVPPAPAGLMLRAIALLIDAPLVVLLYGACVFFLLCGAADAHSIRLWLDDGALWQSLVGAGGEPPLTIDRGDRGLAWIIRGCKLLLVVSPALLLCSACESYLGGTPGKFLLGAFVVRRTPQGLAPLSLESAFARNAAKFFSVMPFGLGFLMPRFTEKKQALHDLLASCVVLQTPVSLVRIASVAIGGMAFGVLSLYYLQTLHYALESRAEPRPSLARVMPSPSPVEIEDSLSENRKLESSLESGGTRRDLNAVIALLDHRSNTITVYFFTPAHTPHDIDTARSKLSHADAALLLHFSTTQEEFSLQNSTGYSLSFFTLPDALERARARSPLEITRRGDWNVLKGALLSVVKAPQPQIRARIEGDSTVATPRGRLLARWQLDFLAPIIEVNSPAGLGPSPSRHANQSTPSPARFFLVSIWPSMAKWKVARGFAGDPKIPSSAFATGR